MNRPTRHLPIIALYALLTLVLTYPIGVQLGSAVKDLGDPLLNSWILAWETHSLFGGQGMPFFDTNIFYPHRNTLAYSEMLIPQLLVAAPVIRASGNPVLAHNLVLLLSILATATATYLLAWHLTSNRPASLTAGLILAFCPFMFDHLAHVQIFFAAGIPLSFLFLHRYFERQRTLDAVLFALVWSIQVLANTYYAVYLTFFAGLYAVFQAAAGRLWRQPRFWAQVLLIAILGVVLISPFYLHYLELKRDMGFSRELPPAIPISSYLAAPAANRLYGALTAGLGRQEARLFPGFVALGLGLLGIWSSLERSAGSPAAKSEQPRSSHGRWLLRLVDAALVALAIVLLLWALGLTFDTHLGPLRISLRAARNPLVLMLLLLGARWFLIRRLAAAQFGLLPRLRRPTYPILLVAAFILSLGTAPYQALLHWLPGFDSLRAVPRIHVMFMFALAVLAAEGMALVVSGRHGSRRKLLMVILPVLVLVEYFSVPLPLRSAPTVDDFPPAHHWLAQQNPDTVFAAYPHKIRNNILNLYYSTMHWRRTVNGFSGFMPPLYMELTARGRRLPSAQALDDLRSLGVDFVLVDGDALRKDRGRSLATTMARGGATEVRVETDGTVIYRLERQHEDPVVGAEERSPLEQIDLATLALDASAQVQDLEWVVDGDSQTRWRAPMTSGQEIVIGWQEELIPMTLEIDLSGYPHGYPRGYRVESSADGRRWRTVARQQEYRPPILGFLKPLDFRVRLELDPVPARHLRLVQTGSSDRYLWAVSELAVWVDSR